MRFVCDDWLRVETNPGVDARDSCAPHWNLPVSDHRCRSSSDAQECSIPCKDHGRFSAPLTGTLSSRYCRRVNVPPRRCGVHDSNQEQRMRLQLKGTVSVVFRCMGLVLALGCRESATAPRHQSELDTRANQLAELHRIAADPELRRHFHVGIGGMSHATIDDLIALLESIHPTAAASAFPGLSASTVDSSGTSLCGWTSPRQSPPPTCPGSRP